MQGEPDLRHDLEQVPWPFATDSAEEIVMTHVLEHIGDDPRVFMRFMKELYRVAAPGASIHIIVPHPRHDDFLNDPTHVRAITPETLAMFSMKNCLLWEQQGMANTPLAVHHAVDFEVVRSHLVVDEPYWRRFERKEIDAAELQRLLRECNNVGKAWQITLKAIKPARRKLDEA